MVSLRQKINVIADYAFMEYRTRFLLKFSSCSDKAGTSSAQFSHILSESSKIQAQKYLHMEKHTKKMPWLKNKDASKLKHAAVLIPLCYDANDNPSLLFTRRSNKLFYHRGQVSFPGGKSDHADNNLIETALRESEEETGIIASEVDVWGQLPPVPGRNYEMAVTGVIANCANINTENLRLNHDEVEYVFTRTFESLCREEDRGYTVFKHDNVKPYSLPVFLGQDRIWGLTAIILHLTLRILANDLYSYNFPGAPRGL